MVRLKKILVFFNIIFVCISVVGIVHGVKELAESYYRALNENTDEVQYDAHNDKRVLLISSSNSSEKDAEFYLSEFRHVFYEQKVMFDTQFMDMMEYNTEENRALFYNSLKYKIQNHAHYNAIILDGDEALHFALEYQHELFEKIPMVFISVNDTAFAKRAAKNPYVTGVVIEPFIQDTLEVAIRLYPYSNTIYAIYDNSPKGQRYAKEFFDLEEQFPDYIFRGLNTSECSREIFGKRLELLDRGVILLALEFGEDASGNHYLDRDNTFFVANHAKLPIFTGSPETVLDGQFIGGKLQDFREMIRVAGLFISEILEGDIDLPSLTGLVTVESTLVLDDYQLKKFGLSTKTLEDYDIRYINRTSLYWQKNKSIFIPVVEILASLLLILIVIGENLCALYVSRRQIRKIAIHDTHTGLYNRYSIIKKLEEVMARKIKFSVLLVDIDDFKSINDFNSHECGDYILLTLASRLRELVEDGNYEVSRYYGDKFLLIYKGAHMDSSDPEIYFLRQLLGNAIEYKDKTFFIETNIGIVNSNDTYTADDYCINADIAMNEAKLLGRNKYVLFTDAMKTAVMKNAEIGFILEDACQNEGFTVLYQPQINITTGEIRGYEALVRLNHEKIPPASFIPIAEKDGHIAKIGRIVTEKVIRQMAEWRNCGVELHKVSINFSVGQVGDKSYIPYLKKLMATYEIPADLIGIEITESLFLGNKTQAMELFNQFDEIGITIALDDFGTGYSSLNYLTYLPVESVKIDKSTVDFYLDGKAAFIENIVNLVHCLGMKIIIEGVEQKWQFEKLKSFKCDYIQGFLFSKPLTGEEVKSFMRPTLA